jgi:PAS domain S-box-containing protein
MEINLDPLVTISSDGKITDVNQATVDATGISREDLINSDFASYFTNPKQAQIGYEKVLKDGKVVDYPLELQNRDGRIMNVICNGSTYKDETGNITGVFVAARDVTEINKLRKTAEEVNKLKSMSKLLENIAHQWRQPLSVISTSVSAIKVSLEFGLISEDKFMSNIDKAIEYTQSLSKTIDNFQMLFQNDLVKQQIEMQHLIDTILVNYQDYIQKNNITLIQKIDNFSIKVYEHELTQIISGLLTNIVEHAKNNELIFITATTDTKNTFINIKDSGGGVGDEILNSMFQAYFTPEHQFMGKGIGLYFVYQLIKRHFNGTITAQNTTYTYNNKFYKGLEITIKIPIV